MQLTRSEFFKIVFGGSAWLAASDFAPRITPAVADTARLLPVDDVELVPFHQLRRRTYVAYWEVLTPSEYITRVREVTEERERVRKLEAATAAYVPAGDAEAEKAFNQRGEDTTIVRADGRSGRRAGKWFSFDVMIAGDGPFVLVVTYNSDNRRPRTFDIFVDDSRVGEQTLAQSSVSKFFDVEYALPAAVVAGKATACLRFQATNGNEVAPVFGIRLVTRS